MEKEAVKTLEKIFPEYFSQFDLPKGAREEKILTYRACRSGQCDQASFLPSFEQKGCVLADSDDPKDPGIYSLSTYEKPKDVKRFAAMTSDMKVPYTIAIGYTEPLYGLVQRSKERCGNAKERKKVKSHVDWWLYKNATPYEVYELIPDFEQYLKDYKEKEEEQ